MRIMGVAVIRLLKWWLLYSELWVQLWEKSRVLAGRTFSRIRRQNCQNYVSSLCHRHMLCGLYTDSWAPVLIPQFSGSYHTNPSRNTYLVSKITRSLHKLLIGVAQRASVQKSFNLLIKIGTSAGKPHSFRLGFPCIHNASYKARCNDGNSRSLYCPRTTFDHVCMR